MVSKIASATISEFRPCLVEIEVSAHRGLPAFVIIGLPSRAVDEARERISAALLNSGMRIGSKRCIINLSPVEVKKTSSSLDLGIALALLVALQKMPPFPTDTLFLGELSLDGRIKPLHGVEQLLKLAETAGYAKVVLPSENAHLAVTKTSLQLIPVSHIRDCLTQIPRNVSLSTQTKKNQPIPPAIHRLEHIIGQEQAKRAVLIAATGHHHLLMIGPPGVGKTLLAQTLHSLLPSKDTPFRAPHHTITTQGLIGGGRYPKPGEITFADGGILFLDELAEFSRHTLESLRQPLESPTITFPSGAEHVTFPCHFTLIAATNPCPCGFYGSADRHCVCSPQKRERYLHTLSQPFLDRIPLQVWVDQVKSTQLLATLQPAQTIVSANQLDLTQQAKLKITAAQKRRDNRLAQKLPIHTRGQAFLEKALAHFHLSTRGFSHILSVATTIADLESADMITEKHIAEALQFRTTLNSIQEKPYGN